MQAKYLELRMRYRFAKFQEHYFVAKKHIDTSRVQVVNRIIEEYVKKMKVLG